MAMFKFANCYNHYRRVDIHFMIYGYCHEYTLVYIYIYCIHTAVSTRDIHHHKLGCKPYHYLVGGDWNMSFIFPYIGNFIIPIDFHISKRGSYTTNQLWLCIQFQQGLCTFKEQVFGQNSRIHYCIKIKKTHEQNKPRKNSEKKIKDSQ